MLGLVSIPDYGGDLRLRGVASQRGVGGAIVVPPLCE